MTKPSSVARSEIQVAPQGLIMELIFVAADRPLI
jgi:hypothetical protein